MDNREQAILDGIDPEIMGRLATRREAIRKGMSVSSVAAAGLVMSSVPVALAALSKEVYAQSPQDILGVLQFAFLLENLENEFYKAVLGTSAVAAQNNAFNAVRGQIPAGVRAAIQLIQRHEQQHVDFIRATIQRVGGTAPNITANDFDFTGGNGSNHGPFVAATTNLDVLLLATQAIEDTGVRAYKGQIPLLLNNTGNATADLVLESACRIETVEGRHASKIRRIRRERHPGVETIRHSGYVLDGGLRAAGVGNITLPPEAVAMIAAVYAGEENTVQVAFNGTQELRIDTANLPNTDEIGDAAHKRAAATMAFDAPLTREQVTNIVRNFIKDDPTRGLP
jgi:hypothetical protein